MKNYVSAGNNVTIAAPYAVSAGEGVLVGQLFGVAFGDAENGAECDIATVGIYDLAKPAAVTFAVGEAVYFDADAKQARAANETDSNSAGAWESQIGVAVESAGAGATTVRVRLGVPVALS